MFFSIVNSVFSLLFGLLYNNYLISIYGSPINGLISTLTQFVSFFSIIEGGYTTAAVVSSYSSFVNEDFDSANNILYTTKIYFFRVGLLVSSLVMFFGFFYIKSINSPLSNVKTYLLLLISLLDTIGSLCLLSKYTVVLYGNNEEYVEIIISLISRIIYWVLSIILMRRKENILVVYSIRLVNIAINLLLFDVYKKRKYNRITFKGIYDVSLISGTKDVLFQKIASTVFSSTDLILISSFINLSYSSVYNLYYTIYKTISTFVFSCIQSPFNSFGQLYSKNGIDDSFVDLFDIYNTISIIILNTSLIVTSQMILPFIGIYAAKITDFNYIYPSLVYLLYTLMYIQSINRPYGTILNATGNFKNQNIQCALAAVINIVLSTVLLRKIGIYGVVIGSSLGTLMITIANIYVTNTLLFKNACKRNMVCMIINYFFGMLSIFISLKMKIKINGYFMFVMICLIDAAVVIICVLTINGILNKTTYKKIIAFIKNKTNLE